jgi:hypothetical protein
MSTLAVTVSPRQLAAGTFLALAWLMLPPAFGAGEPGAPAPTEAVGLFTDPTFRRGFQVYATKPGKKVVEDLLVPAPASEEPAWGLAQWSSRFSLAGRPAQSPGDGAVRFADESKHITFGPTASGSFDLMMAMDARREYGDRLRRQGEPWPHLLVEQRFSRHPSLGELQRLPFRIEYRLTRSQRFQQPGWSDGVHAAQFLAYLTIQNLNRQSSGYGDFLWFGVPLYDSRHRSHPGHAAADSGTGKFIYNPPASAYTDKSARDGDWVAIDRDLLPLIHDGLNTAWQRGFLLGSRDAADYHLGSFNLGWEMPGTFDVEMQVRGLGLEAVIVNLAFRGVETRPSRPSRSMARGRNDHETSTKEPGTNNTKSGEPRD